MTWFYLALLAPLLYAIVNLLDDNLLHYVYESPSLAAVSAGLFGSLPLLSLFVLHAHALPPRVVIMAVLTGMLTLGYYYFYFRGLESETPAVVVALLGLAPVFLPLFAHVFVHEHLVGPQAIGFGIVLVASLALAITDFKTFTFSRALVPALVAVCLLDAAALFSKSVYQQTDFYSGYMYFSLGMGLGGLGFFIIMFRDNVRTIVRSSKNLKRLLPVIVITELMAVGAELTMNLAISRGPVSLVKVIMGIQPMFVLLIALALYPFWPQYFREVKAGKLIRKFAIMAILIGGLAVVGMSATT